MVTISLEPKRRDEIIKQERGDGTYPNTGFGYEEFLKGQTDWKTSPTSLCCQVIEDNNPARQVLRVAMFLLEVKNPQL